MLNIVESHFPSKKDQVLLVDESSKLKKMAKGVSEESEKVDGNRKAKQMT